jgi:hypothetical protein
MSQQSYLSYERANEAYREVFDSYPPKPYSDGDEDRDCEAFVVACFVRIYHQDSLDFRKHEMSLLQRLEDFNRRFPLIQQSVL